MLYVTRPPQRRGLYIPDYLPSPVGGWQAAANDRPGTPIQENEPEMVDNTFVSTEEAKTIRSSVWPAPLSARPANAVMIEIPQFWGV